MSALRVLHLLDTLGLGGAEVMLSQTLPLMQARGAQVRVRAFSRPDDLATTLRLGGVDVRTAIDGEHPTGSRGRMQVFAQLAAELYRHPADVVHTHLFHPTLVGRAVALLPSAHRPRLVTSLHNPDYSNMDGVAPWKVGARRRFDWATALASTDRLIAVSQGVCDDFERHMGRRGAWGRIEVIPNAIDVEALAQTVARVDRRAARAELGVTDEELLIVAVGRITYQKNFDLLIEVAETLRARGIAARVLVIGDGEDRARFTAVQGRFVTFLGRKPREAVQRAFAACDVYVQPSRWEAFGIAVLEAMAASRPVVACDVPGLNEVVASDETGALVPRGDAAAMVRALTLLAGDTTTRGRWGDAGLARARAHFGLGTWVDRTLHLYQRVAQR